MFEAYNQESRSSSQILYLESEIEEFEPSSVAWNQKRKCSRQVLGLDSGMEEF